MVRNKELNIETIARGEFNKTLAFLTVYRTVLEMQSLSINYFVDMKIIFSCLPIELNVVCFVMLLHQSGSTS